MNVAYRSINNPNKIKNPKHNLQQTTNYNKNYINKKYLNKKY